MPIISGMVMQCSPQEMFAYLESTFPVPAINQTGLPLLLKRQICTYDVCQNFQTFIFGNKTKRNIRTGPINCVNKSTLLFILNVDLYRGFLLCQESFFKSRFCPSQELGRETAFLTKVPLTVLKTP